MNCWPRVFLDVCGVLLLAATIVTACDSGYNVATGTLGASAATNATRLRISPTQSSTDDGDQRFVSLMRFGSVFQGDISSASFSSIHVVVDNGTAISRLRSTASLRSFVVFTGGTSVDFGPLTDGCVGELRLTLSFHDTPLQVILPLADPSVKTTYVPMRGFVPSFATDVVGLVVGALQGSPSLTGWVRVLPLLPTPAASSSLLGGSFTGWITDPPCYSGGVPSKTYILPPLQLPQAWADVLANSAVSTAPIVVSVGALNAFPVDLPYYVDSAGQSASATATLTMNMRREYMNLINVHLRNSILALSVGIVAVGVYVVLLVLVRRDVVTIPVWFGGKRPTVDFWVNPRVLDDRADLLSTGSGPNSRDVTRHGMDAFDS